MSAWPPPAALYLATSWIDDWADQGPAVIQWSARRETAPWPWPGSVLIADYAALAPNARVDAAQAISRLLLREEALAVERAMAGLARVRIRGLEPPLTAAEALALQNPGTRTTAPTLWRVRPPADAIPNLAIPIEGIVALWPWPHLAPEEIAPLLALRERHGRDPLSPT